eukprot:7845828-Alexandrium_andersonii.AAC.1
MEIQRRGRWSLEKSVRRYEQVGRLHVVLAKLPVEIIRFSIQCEAHMVDLVKNPKALAGPQLA